MRLPRIRLRPRGGGTAPSASRINQLRRRVIRTRKIKRAAGVTASVAGQALLDFLAGFLDFELEDSKKNKLGLFGGALASGIAGTSADDSLPIPTMETPQKVSKVNNPTFATISKQLDNLVKTANKIGVYTKEQQDSLLNQIKQAKKTASEQQLEQKSPNIPEAPEEGDGSNLEPLDESIDNLIQKIDELSDTLTSQGGNNGGGFLDSLLNGLGLASLFRRGGGARAARIARPALVRSASSPTGYRYAAGAVNAAGETLGGRFAQASRTRRAIDAVRGGVRVAGSRAAGTVASMAATSRVAGVITAGVRSIGRQAGRSAITSAVRRVAGPLIAKTLGRTALKSIPIVGAGIGAAFAIGRLLKGDVIGAGLDLASGLGGPLTAIPAFAATLARDTYAGVYGVQPEQDPNFNKNWPEIKSSVEELIREALGMSVTTARTPTSTEVGEAVTPPTAPQRVSGAPAAPPPNPPSPNAGMATPAAPPAVAPPPVAQEAPSSAATPAAAPAPPPAATADMVPPTNAPAVPVESQSQAASLSALSMSPPSMAHWEPYGYMPDTSRFMPQTGQTSRGAAQGKGNIPDPVYNGPYLEALKAALFFDYAS